MYIFESFHAVMTGAVIPHRNKHSDWERLDGAIIPKGNRKPFAYFMYKGKKWKIHSDTRFEMLLKAYDYMKDEKDPFIISRTKKDNLKLDLKSELLGKHKYLYIYHVQ